MEKKAIDKESLKKLIPPLAAALERGSDVEIKRTKEGIALFEVCERKRGVV